MVWRVSQARKGGLFVEAFRLSESLLMKKPVDKKSLFMKKTPPTKWFVRWALSSELCVFDGPE